MDTHLSICTRIAQISCSVAVRKYPLECESGGWVRQLTHAQLTFIEQRTLVAL